MQTQDQTRNDRARFPIEVREIYYRLSQGTDPEETPFETLKDVFMFSATIGYLKGLSKKLGPGPKSDMRMEVFSDKDQTIMKAIAIASIGNIDVLERKNDEVISGAALDLIEEFAYGGILELKATLIDQPGAALWNLVELIKLNNGH